LVQDERKFDHHHKGFLDSEERRRLLDPEKIIASLPLTPEQTVGDVGAGTGFFTLPLAERLPLGKVFAFDVQEQMLAVLRERVARLGLGNIEIRASRELRLPVADGALDGVLAAFMLHETSDLGALLAELRRVVRTDGWLAVLEFHKRQGSGGPPLAIRLSVADTLAALAAAGFQASGEPRDLNEQNYLVLARAIGLGRQVAGSAEDKSSL
jgi:ubiquinone/menaquinone biosynthesis C-methylase UbiE